jgi:hypothetical protein
MKKNRIRKCCRCYTGKGIANTEQIIPMCGVLAWTDRLTMGMSHTDPGYRSHYCERHWEGKGHEAPRETGVFSSSDRPWSDGGPSSLGFVDLRAVCQEIRASGEA